MGILPEPLIGRGSPRGRFFAAARCSCREQHADCALFMEMNKWRRRLFGRQQTLSIFSTEFIFAKTFGAKALFRNRRTWLGIFYRS
jgi:hypothetical protein